MIIYYGGGEIPSHKNLLHQEGVHNIAISYMGLRRRTKFVRPWLISDKFEPEDQIFLDSGAYTLNQDESKYTEEELLEIYSQYQHFVNSNIDSIIMVSEFDANSLGNEWIKSQREDFWSHIPDSKFLPIWHPENGLADLSNLCSTYQRVGIPKTALGERNLAPTLNGYVSSHGTKLHGVAMTKPEEMREIRWDSVASTSWISPSQFGDTIVWVGNQLKRYPKKYKDTARKRHRTLFIQNGFDADKIAADDSTELLRLSIWSWKQVEENLNNHRVATNPQFSDESENVENGEQEVVILADGTRNSLPTVRKRTDEERTIIPSMGMSLKDEKYTDNEGKSQTRELPIITSRSQSLRVCNSCFLANKCPAYEPGSNCAYDIPVVIRTRQQLMGLFDALIEMQTQRVLFMKMAEDLEGGYVDPNLSTEMKNLRDLIKQKHEMEQEGFSLQIQAKGNGPGILSRMLGSNESQRANALPAPIKGDDAIAEVIDVDVLEDIPNRESSN